MYKKSRRMFDKCWKLIPILAKIFPRNRFIFLIKLSRSDDLNIFWVRYSHEGSLQSGFDQISLICMSCFKLLFFYKNYVIRKLFYSFTWVSQFSTLWEGKITREHPCPLCKKVCGVFKTIITFISLTLKEIFAQLLLENHLAVGELISKLKKDTIYLKNSSITQLYNLLTPTNP